MNQEDIIKAELLKKIAQLHAQGITSKDFVFCEFIIDFIRAKIQEAYNAGGKRMGEIMKEEMEIEIPKIKQEARSQLIKEIEILKDDKRKGDYGRGFDRAIDQVIKYLKK